MSFRDGSYADIDKFYVPWHVQYSAILSGLELSNKYIFHRPYVYFSIKIFFASLKVTLIQIWISPYIFVFI